MSNLSVPEKADLLHRAFSALSTPQDILFAVDGSGSVKDDQFDTMRFCIRTLVNYLQLDASNPKYRVGGIQFDSGVYVISNLTADAIQFNTAVVSMPQKRGGTDAGRALSTCSNMFDAEQNQANKTIVLMTDGDVTTARAVLPILAQQNIKVISIGVGLAGNTETAVMALSNHAVFVRDFSEMNQVVSYLSVKPGCPPEINIRTRSSKQASFDIVSSTPFTRVDFESFSENTNQWMPFGSTESNVFYVKGLNPSTVYSIRGKAINGTAVTDWSKVTQLRTLRENPETAVLQGRDLASNVQRMISNLQQLSIQPELKQHFGLEYLNIALLGRIGNGKSAYFNTIWSIMNGSYDEPQLTKSDITTVTLNITKRFLKNNQNNAIRLCDTYGWKGNESWSQELEFFLDGALRDGYKENSDLLKSLNNNPNVGDRIHAVIIVYEMPSIYTDSHIEELKKFFAKMTSKGYQPIVILTKPDLVPEANITDKLEAIFDTGIIDSHIQEFSARTKIPPNNIFPVMNYTGQYAQPEWVREKLALNAFQAAIQTANTKISNDMKKFILVKNNKAEVIGTATFDGASETPLNIIRERIMQCNAGLKHFGFMNQQGSEIPVSAEETTTLTRTAKSDNTYSFWTVTVAPRAAQNVQQAPVGIDLTVPDALTIKKDNHLEGAVVLSDCLLLSDLRGAIEEQLDLKNFQFLTTQNTAVPLQEESRIHIGTCIVNQDSVAVVDSINLPNLTASELASEDFSLVVLNNKDNSTIGTCLATKAMTLRQLEDRMKEIDVPTGFVFVHKGAVIKPRQLDQFRVKHVMFKREDGADCITIAEPDH